MFHSTRQAQSQRSTIPNINLDLPHLWLVEIEAWIFNEAGIEFVPVQAGLRAVK
jgi:hypothetical protein